MLIIGERKNKTFRFYKINFRGRVSMNFVIFDYSDGRQEFKWVNEIKRFPEGDVIAFTYYRQDLFDDNGKASSVKYLIGKPAELKTFDFCRRLSFLEYDEKVSSNNYEGLYAICEKGFKRILLPLNSMMKLVNNQEELSRSFYNELSMDFESKSNYNNQIKKRVQRRNRISKSTYKR